jgi:hypothetical protein
MADQLERALLTAELTELQKQQSEAHIHDIYVGLTADGEAACQKRGARITSLRLQLAELDASPTLVREAPQGRAPRSRE